ncbi:AAA family ATPase [Kribbella sp. NPDC003505]|uniref:AAA family ATPase n=1 Tax=Kribbella sp. NPDC003505 TaxID=3154448 RepID=UPI0033A7DD22
MFLLQMSGVPGSGKSTVAAHVVAAHGAVAVDYDVIKSAILDAGFDLAASTKAAYETMYGLARHLLTQGHHVVMDSPCFWPRIVTEGMSIAAAQGATYKYIECQVTDLQVVDERLRRRPRLRSHRPTLNDLPKDVAGDPVDGEALFREWMTRIERPATEYLALDMHRPLADLVPEIDAYLKA